MTRPNPLNLSWAGLGCAVAIACLSSAAVANEHSSEAAPKPAGRSTMPVDPMSLIQGSADAWSVSQTEAGCYLMSAYRKGSSRLAIGRHPALGLGLFALSFALSTSGPEAREKVTIEAEAQAFNKLARVAGPSLLFVPLDDAETGSALRELQMAGNIWLVVRGTWISHGGQGIAAAAEEYGKLCANPNAGSG